ncbi:DUF695 domain-containing protein [Pontibacter sp. SGAir0037]|uniref:DUF695 domain-containing protein n=1 Tax=Pontibacter sp. SGAir0037 TaxID=2571030 RepID=UPI0010CD422F|nr:DUF695 domain-containing protein [Pontibacter sp. SGAir0037]QCR21396.1 DUF695 domain-containing protein [Pontibacter sp. SGAir0037]
MEKKEHTPDWEVYFCELDEKPASISVDLALEEQAPLEDKPQVFELVVGCRTSDEDGFPTDEAEWDLLGEMEDALVQQLVGSLGATFVGKTLNDGKRTFYFYSNHEALLEVFAGNVMQQFTGYEFNANTQEDKDWSLYFDFLYPEPTVMQTIQNGRLIRHMQEQGDQSHIPRKITHVLYFTDEEQQDRFLEEAEGYGYSLEEKIIEENTPYAPFQLLLSKVSKADEASVNEASIELWILAEEYNGQYDGWEAGLVKEND